MASTMFSTAVLERTERPPPASPVSTLVFFVFLAGLVAGVAGFALLAMGHQGWARTLFVGDLVAMLGSVALGALASPRAPARTDQPR
jgi:hypothetical protein